MEDFENFDTTIQIFSLDDTTSDALLKDFTKETLFGRLESTKEDLRQFGELARVEIAFSALNIRPNLTRNARTRGDFVGSSRADEDKKN